MNLLKLQKIVISITYQVHSYNYVDNFITSWMDLHPSSVTFNGFNACNSINGFSQPDIYFSAFDRPRSRLFDLFTYRQFSRFTMILRKIAGTWTSAWRSSLDWVHFFKVIHAALFKVFVNVLDVWPVGSSHMHDLASASRWNGMFSWFHCAWICDQLRFAALCSYKIISNIRCLILHFVSSLLRMLTLSRCLSVWVSPFHELLSRKKTHRIARLFAASKVHTFSE